MAKPTIDTTHTAAGQLAGYIFQPDRALVMLCLCTNRDSVSIELVDDVAITDDDGNVIYREQDKSSIQQDAHPFKARSKDLWNTLMIWINEIKNGTLNIDNTKLVCVTNKKLESNTLLKQIAKASTMEDVEGVISLLIKAAQNPPKEIQKIVPIVLAEIDLLKKLIPKISLIEDNNLETRNNEIADELHLSDDIKNNVIESLRGWLINSILTQLNNGQAPIIKKSDFISRYQKAINKETDNRISFKAKSFLKRRISSSDRGDAIDRMFIKQLEVIEHPEKNNIILEAIDDFLCSESERTRLTLDGDITRDELQAMDDESKERWVVIFRRKMTQFNPSMSDDELGSIAYEIYDNTIANYSSELSGYKTPYYLTKGSFHKLSDELEIGWHPNWQTYFLNNE